MRTCTFLFPWLQLGRNTCRWSMYYDSLTSVTIALKGTCALIEHCKSSVSDTTSEKSRANLYSELFSFFFSSTESIKRDIILWDFIVFIFVWLQILPVFINRETNAWPALYWKHCQTRSELILSSLRYYHQKLAIRYVLPLEMRSTISESVIQ